MRKTLIITTQTAALRKFRSYVLNYCNFLVPFSKKIDTVVINVFIIFQYVGIEYLKSLRIDDELMFSGLRHMCSWATCGFATPSSSAAKIDDRISGSLPNSKDNEDVLNNVFQPYVPW